jgi:hypothetical protein
MNVKVQVNECDSTLAGRKNMKIMFWHSKRSIQFALLAVVVIVVGVQCIKILPAAHAAGVSGWESDYWPNDDTHPNVISDCNGDGGNVKPDACLYHVVSTEEQLEDYRQASVVVSQCGEIGATFTLTWMAAETTKYTWGKGSTIAFGPGRIVEDITAGLKSNISQMTTHSLGETANAGGSVSFEVPAGHKGWITWAPRMYVAHGWMEVQYPTKVYGHYYWYYPSQGSGNLITEVPKRLPDGSADGSYRSAIVPC